VWAVAGKFALATCSLQFTKASAAKLLQQEKNDSEDVQRGILNMSNCMCTVVNESSWRVLVDGRSVAAGAPALTHICTVGACGTKPRRGPPAGLPGQAFDGMLGATVRIAHPQDCEARFFVNFCERFMSI
jgi:hypothetical protein